MDADTLPRTLEITAPHPAATSGRLRRCLPVAFAIAVTLLMGSSDAWAKGNVSPAPIGAVPAKPAESEAPEVQLARDLAAARGLSFDQLYAEREQEAQALGLFEGGDIVVISSTTLIIVLLIILILVVA